MFKKAIVFDVDGVITHSGWRKDIIIEEVLDKNGLLKLPWVSKILTAGLNRILILQEIQKIQEFNFERVLSEINRALSILETTTTYIESTCDFIKKNAQEYEFFTNTSMPKRKLIEIFERLELTQYFTELLAYEDGSKKENITYIMQVYGYTPWNMLFIDDKQAHIDAVQSTGIHSLLFTPDGVSLQQQIQDIF